MGTLDSYEAHQNSTMGLALIHLLAKKTGLPDSIDNQPELLKRHLSYHESDHIMNMAYNLLAGGTYLQDIELLRNDSAWLDASLPGFGKQDSSYGVQTIHP